MGNKRQPGHRQKGAGTVVVSRGDQVRQGVLVKEWQRTPIQLLHEYCQSKKRIQARYTPARCPEGRFRTRCILPDDKNSAKDLVFCPEQDFETMDEAKHCAALLALKQVDPTRPLERKLPDPYRNLWLAMSNDSNTPSNPKPVKKTARKTPTEPTPPVPDEQVLDLWSNSMEPNESETKIQKGIPKELTSDRRFSSRAEYEQAKLAQAQKRNDRERAIERRERANPDKHVLMSASCREMIEGVLKQLGVEVGTGGTVTKGSHKEKGGIESAPDDVWVTKRLESIGFRPEHIHGALKACRRESIHRDEYMTSMMDWLCLNVTEGELPKGFNPQGKQLDVVLSSNAPPSRPLVTVLIQKLMKYGYDRMDAVLIADEYVKDNKDVNVNDESPSDEIVIGVLEQAFRHIQRYTKCEAATKTGLPSTEEVSQMREDEIFALEAIYDEKMAIKTWKNPCGRCAQLLVITLSDEIVLEIYLSAVSVYPFSFPVIGMLSTNPSHHVHLLRACCTAIQSCQGSLGEPMLYDLCVGAESALMDAISQEKQTKTEVRPLVLTHKEEAFPPQTARIESQPKQTVPKHKNRTKINRPSPKSIDPAQVKRLNESLLQLRQAKETNTTFQEIIQARARLPAAAEEKKVLQYMVNNQVLLICGATGCGKTTQIPQFILDEYINSGRGGECQIICTQPRRIAAIGVATRVAQERCEEIANVVGYQIRMEAKKSITTRLLFCTTGVLLRRLLTDRTLMGITHVIVDEVHERNVDTDFLLSILRDLLPQRPTLRLILMSATMDADLFVTYFTSPSHSKGISSCPVLEIPGFTFPVQCHFLEDVLSMTNYQVPKHLLSDKRLKKSDKKTRFDEMDDVEEENEREAKDPQEIVRLIDDSKIDYDLCVHIVSYVVMNQNKTGAILVFLPGMMEIKRLIDMLVQHKEIGSRLWVLPLHGSLSGSDQAMVFRSPPVNKIKVIVSTNIAETSITINDITTVIDCGKVKEMVYDSQLRRSQLLDCWASRAACDQRKGRAGRVQAGTCYRLFSHRRFERMDAQLSAEIHRVSLQQLCLQIKSLELGPIRSFLAKAIEPPKQEAINSAMSELIAIAAFKPIENNGKKQQGLDEVQLTPLGSHLAMLPLDARIGKFLIYGSILRCLEPVTTIAACVSSKSPFLMLNNDSELRERQDALKKELNADTKSDHLLLVRLVERYSVTNKGQGNKRAFCREFGLSYDTLETILELKQQYLQQLDVIGFYDASMIKSKKNNIENNSNECHPRIVKAALCAGLYANVIQVVYPDQKYFQSAHGVVAEDHDAKKIRYFVQQANSVQMQSATTIGPKQSRERVFLHPCSCNFTQQTYDSPWLLYTELVQTSKVFVRESTMVNPYALLLFGGRLDVNHEKNVLCLDGWIRFHAVARIGVLIKAIRRKLNELLIEKIANPALDISQSQLVLAISHLLKTEGM